MWVKDDPTFSDTKLNNNKGVNMTYKVNTKLNVQESDGCMWDYIYIATTSKSVDDVLTKIETLPEVIEFLNESTISLEYITIEFNHGDEVRVMIPRYSK